MESRESKQKPTLLTESNRRRSQSVLCGPLKRNACVALAVLVCSGSLSCLTLCASEPSHCCSLGFTGAPEVIPSVKPVNQSAYNGHSCCRQRNESEYAGLREHVSKTKDKNQCCLLDSQTTTPPALLQSIDHRVIPARTAPEQAIFETRLHPPGFTWRAGHQS